MTNPLVDPFHKLLEPVLPFEATHAVEGGASYDAIWAEISASGFLDALVPEEMGGAGLSLAEIEPIFQVVGFHGVALPLGETIIARGLIAQAGRSAPDGPIALATSRARTTTVPGGAFARFVLWDGAEGLQLCAVEPGQAQETGVYRTAHARLMRQDTALADGLPAPKIGLRGVAALLRAALIAGAAHRLCIMTANYANERVQFGKPIGRQQALQHGIAVMAEDMIAARLASQLGAASGMDGQIFAAATAKSTASAAASRLASSAHAVHGAIGISDDYALNILTRRLHEWRLADGSEGYWNTVIGRARLASTDHDLDWIRTAIFAEPV